VQNIVRARVRKAVALAVLVSAAAPVRPCSTTSEPRAEGKSVSDWIAVLEGKDTDAQLHASEVLTGMGERAVPYLIRALERYGSGTRRWILSCLGPMGSAASGALPAISALLHDPSLNIRVSAAATIVRIDCSRVEDAWPALLEGLEGDSFNVARAARAIGSLDGDGARAVPSLIRLVKCVDREAQAAAIGALWMIGPEAKAALPALEEAAKGEAPLSTFVEAAIAVIKGEAPTPVSACHERRSQNKP
jgi:HEAT repeat protein